MKIEAHSPEEYVEKVPADRQVAFKKLRQVLLDNLPAGFEETMSYGMIGYVVPHAVYPTGYHVDPKLPLPFINLANQKNYLALYHNGLYADPDLLAWFEAEYPKHAQRKLDMGKSCIRFKKMDDIPYELIGELAQKVSMQDWIDRYEQGRKP